jgi:succinyl-diaminopimelate desuccinylase
VQKGLLHVKIKIKGRQAHGAYPWQGSNAIDTAMAIVGELKAHRFAYTANRYLHPPTMNVGTIRGGDKVNVVADWCECEIDFRFLPGSTAEQILGVVKAVARRHCRSFEIEIEGAQKPYQIEQGHPLVACLKSAMKKADVNPVIRGSEGATVITFFQDKAIPAVATGFGSSGCAHIADEYVKVSNLHKGARVLESFLTEFTYGD